MSDRYDSKVFAVQFAGNLRADSEPAPARVVTRLRIRSEETDREVQKHRQNANSVPRYVFGSGKNLPLHLSLQAIGSHYFTW
jgi:hypothetical protein